MRRKAARLSQHTNYNNVQRIVNYREAFFDSVCTAAREILDFPEPNTELFDAPVKRHFGVLNTGLLNQPIPAYLDYRYGIPSEKTVDYYRKQVQRLAEDQTEAGKALYEIQSKTLVKLEEMVRKHKTPE
jgi:hypothetical protein